MTRRSISRHVLIVLNLMAAALLCLPHPQAVAQSAQTDTGGFRLELDLEAMLTSRQVFDETVNGDIWAITPRPGRFLIQVPFKVKPGNQSFELDRRVVDLNGSGARFLTWRIRPVEVEEMETAQRTEQQQAQGGGDSAGRRIANARDSRNQVYGELTGDFSGGTGAYRNVGGMNRGGNTGGGGIAPPTAGVAMVESFEGRKLIPRFSDKMLVTPQGTVKWEMERRVNNGEVIESEQLYTMKIDYAKLNERNPAYKDRDTATNTRAQVQQRSSREDRSSRSSSDRSQRQAPVRQTVSREELERERAEAEMARVQARLEREAFQRLRSEVQDLNTDFEQELPQRLWAVFELSQLAKELDIESETFPHLNWVIQFDHLALLRELSLRGFQVEADPEGRVTLGPTNIAQLIELGVLAEQKNVHSRRAVAYVLNFARMGRYTEMGNQLFFIFQSLLEGEDSEARQVAQKELLSTVPPTQATASLLKHVVRANVNNAGEQLDAIANVFEFGAQGAAMNPAQVAEMINTAQQVLDDPNGPPPGKVIEKLLEATRGSDAIIPQLVSGIQFGRMPEQRLQQAMVTVVERAGDHPLAAGWLDMKFVGATNTELVRRSLEVIVSAEAGAQSLGPVIEWGMISVLGVPEDVEPTLKAKIARPIPIDNVQHGLVRALESGDPDIRDLAWRALPRFRLPPEQPRDEAVAAAGGVDRFDGRPMGNQRPALVANRADYSDLNNPYNRLLEAALDQSPTPIQIVQFLAAQPDLVRRSVVENRDRRDRRDRRGEPVNDGQHPDIDRAVHALVQVVLRGSTATSTAAARELVGSGWQLDTALLKLEYGERQGFAMNIYEAMTGRVPVVTSVLRQRVPRNPVVEWFGRQLSEGNVPQASQWIQAFSGENELLDLATINDRDLARGAIATLVAAVGGDDRDAKEMADRIRDMPDKGMAKVQELWVQMRGEIFAKRIRRLEGSYRLVLRVGPELPQRSTGPGAIDPRTGQPITRRKLADDFSSIPAERELALGVLQLRVDGEQVSFGNQNLSVRQHKEKLAIVIDKASEFQNFEHPDLEALGLDSVEQPVELVPLESGQWQGAFNIPGGKAVYVLLYPATDA